MPRKLTIDEIKERIMKIHGDIITLVEKTYINTSTIATFIDKDYGKWETTPHSIINQRSRHRKRANKTKRKFIIKPRNMAQNKEINEKRRQPV